MATKSKTLLVFVPGFYGSPASFATFPSDIALTLRLAAGGGLPTEIETRMFPAFDCKDSSSKAVDNLIQWLGENAGTDKYTNVVLLGHSMGGLLSVDAHRQLRPQISNVVAIFAFDSPFFGLHTHAVTDAPTSLHSAVMSQIPDVETRTAALESITAVSKSAYSSAASSSYSLMTRLHASALDASSSLLSSLPDTATLQKAATSTSSHIINTSQQAYTSAAKVLPLDQAATLASNATQAVVGTSYSTAKSMAERTGIPFVEPEDALKMSQQLASTAYDGAVSGAKTVYDTSATVYSTASKAAEKIPTGAAVVAAGTVAATAGAAGLVAAEALATVGVVGSAAAVATAGVVGGAALVTAGGVVGGLVAANKIRNVMNKTAPTLSVVGGISDSEDEEEPVKEPVVQVPAVETPPETKVEDTKLSEVQERRQQLQREGETRQKALEAKMAELNGGAVVLGESEVSFANEIYVDESVDIPLETAAPEVTEATTIEIITSTIKARPILTTAAVTIGGAALATSAYVAYFYTGGLISLAAPAARSIAVGWVMSQVTEGGKHLKFLYPLWGESRSSCEKRLKYVQEKIQEDKLVFRCFYLELPPIPDPKKDASVTPETEKPAVVRTFIKPPPESVSDLFTPVQMDVLDLQDVVTAHVSMLRRTSNIGMYWYLVDETARSLSVLLTKLEGQKEA